MIDTRTEPWCSNARTAFIWEIIEGLSQHTFGPHTEHYLLEVLRDILQKYGVPPSRAVPV